MTSRVSRRDVLGATAGAAAFGLAGCLASPSTSPAFAAGDADATLAVASAEQLSSPGCACCHEYAAYLRPHLDAELVETRVDDVAARKRGFGVPHEAWSCHTLVLDDYVVEGHVPIAAIERLLAERPAIDGISLPGMPAGSPGMGGRKQGAFRVLAFADGRTSGVFVEL